MQLNIQCKTVLVAMSVGRSVHHFGLDGNISLSTDMHRSQRMNPNDFDDPQTFSLVPL